MNEVGKQLKKGILEILILRLLSRERMYGYQLIQEMDKRSSGVFKMKEGTLYPVLYRLEDNSLIESVWEQEPEKRSVPRKYYKITSKGEAEFINMEMELNSFLEGIKMIMQGGN